MVRKQRKYNFSEDRHKSICIYCIENLINGKCYVGQSVRKVAERWRAHYNQSGKGISLIKNTIRKNGLDNFKFYVLECASSIDDLDKLESDWIEKKNSLYPNGYNLCSGGNSTKQYSMESRRKMSESALKRFEGNERSGKVKRILSEEERELRKKIRIEKMRLSKTGKPSSKRGTKLSEETINKIKLSKTGKEIPKKWKPVVCEDGTEFKSVQETFRAIGCHRSTLTRHLRGELKTVYGKRYLYK